MKRFAPREVFQEAFEEIGLDDYTEIKCTEPYIGLKYYDCCAFFEEKNRKTDSFFADVGEEHLEEYLSTLKTMMEDGELPSFLVEKEKIK